MSRDDRSAADMDTVSTILNVADTDSNINNIRVQRLGKYSQGRCRPVKVLLTSEEEVFHFLRGAKNLNNSVQHKTIRMSSDKTPKQLQYLKMLQTQFQERRNNGEEGLRIRHYNGVPLIERHLN